MCSLVGTEACKNCQAVPDYSEINSINNFNFYFNVENNENKNINDKIAKRILEKFNINSGENYGW